MNDLPKFRRKFGSCTLTVVLGTKPDEILPCIYYGDAAKCPLADEPFHIDPRIRVLTVDSRALRKGEAATAWGYPNGTSYIKPFPTSFVKLRSCPSPTCPAPVERLFTRLIELGYSGGPILDSHGNVIALVSGIVDEPMGSGVFTYTNGIPSSTIDLLTASQENDQDP